MTRGHPSPAGTSQTGGNYRQAPRAATTNGRPTQSLPADSPHGKYTVRSRPVDSHTPGGVPGSQGR